MRRLLSPHATQHRSRSWAHRTHASLRPSNKPDTAQQMHKSRRCACVLFCSSFSLRDICFMFYVLCFFFFFYRASNVIYFRSWLFFFLPEIGFALFSFHFTLKGQYFLVLVSNFRAHFSIWSFESFEFPSHCGHLTWKSCVRLLRVRPKKNWKIIER